ncbi:peptidase M50 [Frankia sp. Cppng1_Ct_nod]|uniref:peptidase M50 n=1 Tax=Frankia sp. Cppng1_Ct_nod TaxID=2897162 RepID=UPI001041A0B3|nr:peptidase M50 [Frankia sp. Cppng1_Ct_nod]
MTADHVPTGTVHTPVSVRPGASVTVAILTFLLAAFTLPDAAPDRPAVAYLSAGLAGAGLLLGLLLVADLARAAVARRVGVRVDGIIVGLFGSRLRAATDISEPGAAARIACAGLLVTGIGGTALFVLGRRAGDGSLALVGGVGLWVGGVALLLTLSALLPTPRTTGGRLLAAAVYRRTGSRERAAEATARTGLITGWLLLALGAAAIFLVGVVGLWVALLGWFALGSGRLELSRLRTKEALAGVRVGDVMGPAPQVLPGWRTVSAVVEETVVKSDQWVFVVADFGGDLVGVVLLHDLASVSTDDRGLTRVATVTVPMAAVATTTPGEPLADLLPRLADRPAAGLALVFDGAVEDAARPRLVGIVSHVEITEALAAASLRAAGAALPSDPGRLIG